jgi:hypothetical protein
MAGFIPGESPPDVITPIRFNINKDIGEMALKSQIGIGFPKES